MAEAALPYFYRTCFFAFVFECIVAVSLYLSGYIEITLLRYMLKYVFAPLLLNTMFIAVGIWIIRFSGFKQKTKAYFISLLFVGVCFVFFTVHIIFNSIYFIFFAPIMLTIIYSDYKLTTITAFTSISVKVISELFIVWDLDKIHPFSSQLSVTNFFISTIILLAFYFISMIVVRFEKQKNEASIQKEMEHYEVQQKLVIDELTNTYNRTALRDAFEDIADDQSANVYIMAMMDLDDFKILNDTYGHIQGDEYLKELGAILKKNCIGDTMPFRYGGDEFCILFKNKSMDYVISMCEVIQHQAKSIAIEEAGNMSVTASVGIARYEKNMIPTQLLSITDTALYKAKTSKGSIRVFSAAD